MATKPSGRKNGRPKNGHEPVTLEVTACEPRLLEYIQDLRELQGFGGPSNAGIARYLMWAEVNRLIEKGRLKQRR